MSSLTLQSLLSKACDELEQTGVPDSDNLPHHLAAHILNVPRLELHMMSDQPVETEKCSEFEIALARLLQHEPLQYVLGRTEFMGLEFLCDRRALIPRPDSEVLVEQALLAAESYAGSLDYHDCCTGSGCIGISVKHFMPEAQVSISDISHDALTLAGENARRLLPPDSLSCLQSDLLEACKDASVDVLTANPPYVSPVEYDQLDRHIADYEPALALVADEDGLAVVRRLIDQAARVLRPGGWIGIEIGESQGASVKSMLESGGFVEIRISRDLGQHDRVVAGRLSPLPE